MAVAGRTALMAYQGFAQRRESQNHSTKTLSKQ
jgi:hypothetical protein